MKRIFVLMMLLFVPALKADDIAPVDRHCDPAYLALDENEKEFVRELDKLRKRLKLPPIRLCMNITEDCRRWSRHMNAVKQLYHGAPYENAARGMESGSGTLRMWINSPPHYAFLRSRSNNVFGIGRDGTYWTYRAAPDESSYVGGHRVRYSERSVAQTRTYTQQRPPKRPLQQAIRRLFK